MGYKLADNLLDLTYMQFFCIYYGNIFKNEESEKDKNKKTDNKSSINQSGDKVTLAQRIEESKNV
jgi:hypothetical protein